MKSPKRIQKAAIRISFAALCAFMALSAAMLAPVVVKAQCPCIVIQCADGKSYCCSGTPQGDKCVYDRSCLNGGRCGDYEIENNEH